MFRKKVNVGSKTIPGAATAESDTDILVLVWSKRRTIKKLKKLGFVRSVNLDQPDDSSGPLAKFNVARQSPYGLTNMFSPFAQQFISVRNADNINYIITSSPRFFKKFADANQVARTLLLTRKEDRITLFQYIVYGNLS